MVRVHLIIPFGRHEGLRDAPCHFYSDLAPRMHLAHLDVQRIACIRHGLVLLQGADGRGLICKAGSVARERSTWSWGYIERIGLGIVNTHFSVADVRFI